MSPLRPPTVDELVASTLAAKELVEHVRASCPDYSQLISTLIGALVLAAGEHPQSPMVLSVGIFALEHARRIVMTAAAAGPASRPAQEPS